ncbi:MAG: hypothetical protein AAF500_12160 [Myxococcota bacterium]
MDRGFTNAVRRWAIQTPFDGPGVRGAKGANLVLALTAGRLRRGRRRHFDRYTQIVFGGIGEEPGYVGGAIRREVFGRRVWTMTVWVDDAAVNRFVASPRHQEAIAVAGACLAESRFRRIELAPTELPVSWNRALELLATPAGC